MREYNREYYAKNKDRIKEHNREYYIKKRGGILKETNRDTGNETN